MSKRLPKNKTSDANKPAADAPSSPGSPMDTRFVEQIAKLMAANDLNTVDLRDGERRVMLRRGPAVPAQGMMYASPPQAAPAPAAPAPSAAPATAASADAGLLKITSPMPGTFYVAPKQGEKPYVSVGSKVDEDSDVCIIEAMKVFNVHKAECRGTIERVLVQDGQPVEFGTVLFLVKPD